MPSQVPHTHHRMLVEFSRALVNVERPMRCWIFRLVRPCANKTPRGFNRVCELRRGWAVIPRRSMWSLASPHSPGMSSFLNWRIASGVYPARLRKSYPHEIGRVLPRGPTKSVWPSGMPPHEANCILATMPSTFNKSMMSCTLVAITSIGGAPPRALRRWSCWARRVGRTQGYIITSSHL